MGTARAERTDLLQFNDHVVIAFDSQAQACAACHALAEIGCAADQIRQWTEVQFLDGLKTAIDIDRQAAGLPRDGREQQAVVAAGGSPSGPRHHWLIVRVKNEGRAQQVVDCVCRFGPQRARHYRPSGFVDLMENRFPSLTWPSLTVFGAT